MIDFLSSIGSSSHWTEPPFISFIYYTFARPAEEVRLLQVKDIREKTIFIPSKRAKNNKGEHITIHQDLEALIQEHGLRIPFRVIIRKFIKWATKGKSWRPKVWMKKSGKATFIAISKSTSA